MLNQPRNSSRTAYRSFRYSLNRDQNVKTADPSSVPKFRIKKNSVLESTMMRTNGFEQYEMSKTLSTANQGQDTVYLRNFFSAMDCEKRQTKQDRDEWRIKPLRFKIQNFEELDTSEFTLLDPFQRHMKSIQTSSKNAQLQLNKQSHEVSLLKGELQNLSKRITNQINQIQRSSSNQLQKFVSLLKENTTKQQQTKLRFKQDLAMLEIQHSQNLKNCNELMERSVELQETIFSCRPYELRETDEWKEFAQTASTTFGVRDGTEC